MQKPVFTCSGSASNFEQCEEFGKLVGAQARTVKHWEHGRSGVPADVALAVVSLNGLIEAVAQVEQVRAVLKSETPQDQAPWFSKAKPCKTKTLTEKA